MPIIKVEISQHILFGIIHPILYLCVVWRLKKHCRPFHLWISNVMTNKFFPQESLTENDLYFVCYMIERVARKLQQPNRYVVESLGYDELYRQLSLASVRHSENPAQVEFDWIEENHLKQGNYRVCDIRTDLNVTIPTPTQMGKVYKRLILNTLQPGEDWVSGLIRVYTNPLCETLDNYNCSAFYEPSPVIAQAFLNGGF